MSWPSRKKTQEGVKRQAATVTSRLQSREQDQTQRGSPGRLGEHTRQESPIDCSLCAQNPKLVHVNIKRSILSPWQFTVGWNLTLKAKNVAVLFPLRVLGCRLERSIRWNCKGRVKAVFFTMWVTRETFEGCALLTGDHPTTYSVKLKKLYIVQENIWICSSIKRRLPRHFIYFLIHKHGHKRITIKHVASWFMNKNFILYLH